jgi:peptide/nickel transport system substrate-binding protein
MEMKRWNLALAVLVALSLLLAACGQPTETPVEPAPPEEPAPAEPAEPAPAEPTEVVFERGETLYIAGAAWGPPNDWNPFIAWSKANTTGTIGLVYETLFMFDGLTGEFTPFLAESGEWVDADTYEMTLRSGLTWSDGEALTAGDVAFTIELAAMYPSLFWSPMWNYLDEIIVDGDLGLMFEFTDPLYQEFANNLYNIPIAPEHLWAGRTEEEVTSGLNENPVGSGAYLYESHSEDRNVWIRNENWWGIEVFGLPAPRRIVDIRTSSNNVALGMVLKGELDLSNNYLPGVAALADQGYVDTYFADAPYMLAANTAVLFLNLTKPPMDDPEFRRALAYAINTDDIVEVAYANLVAPASPAGLLPSLSQFIDQEVVDRLGWTYDSDEARSILAAAGYRDLDGDGFVEAPDGSAIALEVTCPAGWSDWMAAIAVIADSAQEAGINIQDVTPDYGVWNDALTQGTFDMTLNNWAGLSNTPWTLYNLLFNEPIQEIMGAGNFGRYDNPVVFDLVDALAAVPVDDIAGMQAACSAIQEVMLTDVPMIPLWYNGAWAQFSDSAWTNWPTEADDTPNYPPVTWNGYWQTGGLLMLIGLEPAAAE